MALNVGELVAYLRLDVGDFEKGMAKSQAQADKLDGKNVDVEVKADTAAAEAKLAATVAAADKLGFREPVEVKVKADTALAEAKLAAVAASEDAVDEGNKKIAKSSQQAGQGMGALVAAVLLLGPALVPIAAATVGLGVGLGAMGVAGVLAIVGIVQEMGKGTCLLYTSPSPRDS